MAMLVFIAVFFLLVFLLITWAVFTRALKFVWGLLANTILGLIAIFFLNMLGFVIPINLITILVSALFGLLGVAVLALLALFGMI